MICCPTALSEAQEGDEMSRLGDDLIRSLKEALAHAKGEGPGIVHKPVRPPPSGAANIGPATEDEANEAN